MNGIIAGLDTATIVSIIVSVVIPLVSALLSRAHWPQELTGILTLVISAANGFLSQWADVGSAFDWHEAIGGSIMSFIVSVLSYYGLWRNTKTHNKVLEFPRRASDSDAGPSHKAA